MANQLGRWLETAAVVAPASVANAIDSTDVQIVPSPLAAQTQPVAGSTPRRGRGRLRAIPSPTESGIAPADEIKIARHRLRHLAPWNVAPVPLMHAAAGHPAEPLSEETQKRSRRLALQVLAIQMWHAAARSALR